MHRERMKHAISVLRNVTPEQWSYGDWVQDIELKGDTFVAGCGTVACAGGWLALNPVCISQGLSIDGPNIHMPRYRGERGSMALALYLDIEGEEAFRIFIELHRDLAERYEIDTADVEITADTVADELQTLLESYEQELPMPDVKRYPFIYTLLLGVGIFILCFYATWGMIAETLRWAAQ